MSVLITVRFRADATKAQTVAADNEAAVAAVAAEARTAGLLRHRYFAGDSELMAVDEWETAEGFRAFFASNTTIPAIMQQIGVTESPRVEVWHEIDMKDAVW